jgi:hypothetical protein
VFGEYFAARLAEIDEELVELGPEGRFETVSAKTHSVVTTGTSARSSVPAIVMFYWSL